MKAIAPHAWNAVCAFALMLWIGCAGAPAVVMIFPAGWLGASLALAAHAVFTMPAPFERRPHFDGQLRMPPITFFLIGGICGVCAALTCTYLFIRATRG